METSPSAVSIVSHASLPLLVICSGRIHSLNPAAEQLFGVSSKQAVNKPLAVFIGAETLQQRIEQPTAQIQHLRQIECLIQNRMHVLDCVVQCLDQQYVLVELWQERHQDDELSSRLSGQLMTHLGRTLAHEIRNPLGGMRGAAQLLEAELADPGQRELTRLIITEVDRLNALCNRFMFPHQAAQTTDIHGLLDELSRLLQAEFPGLLVMRDYDPSIPPLYLDPLSLKQAALNILRNAAQAHASELQLRTRVVHGVTIGDTYHRSALSIQFRDNGNGVPENLRTILFMPMVSGPNHGTGLGLAIAQAVIQKLAGSIEYRALAEGSEFCLKIPLQRDDG